MATPKRPRSLTLLLWFFCWMDGRAVLWLFFPGMSGSYQLYAALDQLWVYYASVVLTVALAATATGYLWRPKAGWFEASLLALAFLAVSGIAGMWYMVQHLDIARDAYAASRTARGLSTTPDRLDAIFSANVLWAGTAAMTAVFLLLAWMAFRNRAYVLPDVSDE